MEQYGVCIVRMPTYLSAVQLNERSLLGLFESSKSTVCFLAYGCIYLVSSYASELQGQTYVVGGA